jgi:hypothetical protein
MPCLQQQTCVVRNQPLDLSNLDPPKAAAILKANRIKPALGLPFLPLHMDIRRPVMIPRAEEHPTRRIAGMDWNEKRSATIPVYTIVRLEKGVAAEST